MLRMALLAMLVASTTPQKIDVKFDRPNDLSRYRTFAWNKEQKPLENMANHLRLVNAIQKKLMDLGYRIDPRSPDLYVQYTVEQRAEVQANSTQQPSVWDPTDLQVKIDVSREELVSLQIQLKEADSNFLVWDVKGTYPLGTPDRAERQINEAVADIFTRFPTEDDEKDGKKK